MEIFLLLLALGIALLALVVLMGHLYTAVRYVPFVPTQEKVVSMMIEAAKLQDGHKVVDLGCGDGRILQRAARGNHLTAVGIEGSYLVYLLAKVRRWMTRQSYQLLHQDFFSYSLQQVDVVFCYLFPQVMEKLSKKFQEELPQGAKIVSYCFPLKDWEPVEVVQTRPNKPKNFLLYVYQVPQSYEKKP